METEKEKVTAETLSRFTEFVVAQILAMEPHLQNAALIQICNVVSKERLVMLEDVAKRHEYVAMSMDELKKANLV